MQKDHKFFEDIARMASSAGGTIMEMKREMESMVTAQVDKMLRRMDVVTREDFEVVRDMAAKARAEQEKLAARLAEVEKQLAPTKPAAKPAAKKKPTVKNPTVQKSSAKKPGTKKTPPKT